MRNMVIQMLIALIFINVESTNAQDRDYTGKKLHSSEDTSRYNVFVYQNPDIALKLRSKWETQVQGLENKTSRGFLDDLFSVTKNSTFGIIATTATSLVSSGVNLVGGLIHTNKNRKNEWRQVVQRENVFEKTLSMLENLDDFYSSISTTGALDPSSMSFNGFGCLQKRGKDTVLYISCHLDTTEVALGRILRHSKFQLKLDTLIFNPLKCDLPNDSSVLFSERPRFSFSERDGLNLRIDLDVTSSWINQAIQVYNDQHLGQFYIEVPIKEKDLDADSVFRYYSTDKKEDGSEIAIIGDCFIVPRSYIGIRDEEGNFHDAWGTGQYKLTMAIKETCCINPAFENDDDKWKADWQRRKRIKRQSAPSFNIVKVVKQTWDKHAGQWVVSILEAPSNYATQEMLQQIGIVNQNHQNVNSNAGMRKDGGAH